MKRLLRKVREAVASGWVQTVRLAGHVQERWRRRFRSRAFEEALVTLGERMVAAGLDDGQCGAQIAALDRQMRQAHSPATDLPGLRAERRGLLVRLAAAALEEDAPLPGADAEYEAARRARAALAQREGR